MGRPPGKKFGGEDLTLMQASEGPSWWQRNWKWAVPVGCLGAVAFTGAFIVGLGFVVVFAIRSTGAYSEALAMARANPEVVAELGEPIEAGWFVLGSVNVTGSSGEADLSIPLSGPKNTATLYVIARKRAGVWEFELLEVEVKGREDRIDLLAPREDQDVHRAVGGGRATTRPAWNDAAACDGAGSPLMAVRRGTADDVSGAALDAALGGPAGRDP